MNPIFRSSVLLKALAAVATTVAVAAAQAGPVVSLEGPSLVVDAGDTFAVAMSGHGFVKIVGGGADLSYNAALLELVSVTFDPSWNFFTDAGTINNSAGTVTDLSFNVFGSREGDFAIATLDFRAKAAGQATIGMSGSDLYTFATVDSKTLAIGFSGTTVQIAGTVPEPAEWLLMVGGLGVLALVAARRRSRL